MDDTSTGPVLDDPDQTSGRRPSLLRRLQLAWFRRSVRVQGIDLRTERNAIVVAVTRGGVRHDVIVEPWVIRDDDGSIGHSVTAGGIRSFLGGGRV